MKKIDKHYVWVSYVQNQIRSNISALRKYTESQGLNFEISDKDLYTKKLYNDAYWSIFLLGFILGSFIYIIIFMAVGL